MGQPHGPIMRYMATLGMSVDDIFEAAKEAGRQLVVDDEMCHENLKTVSRELMTIEQCVQGGNQYYKQ